MTDRNNLHEKTKKLLRDLNYFLAHVIVYFVCNAIGTFLIFKNMQERWWLFIFIIAWAFGLIYHALRVYGIDVINWKDRNLGKMWSWI